jgi:hypothetical protein
LSRRSPGLVGGLPVSDLDVMRSLFGELAANSHYFEIILSLGVFLALVAALQRGGYV